MVDLTIEDSVTHDNWSAGCGSSQHGIYIANHQDQFARQAGILDKNIFVRRNLMYKNCYNGIQVNGRFNNVILEQNVSYNNESNSGFAFLSGVSHSTVRSNVTFNNNSVGITVFDYDDFCGYDPTGPCPYDQSYNLFENNTVYQTGFDPMTGQPLGSQTAFSIVNSSSNKAVDIGHNTFNNNTLVTYSPEGAGTFGYPMFRYDETAAPATSQFNNNLFFSTQGSPGTYNNVIQTKTGSTATYYTCATATAASGTALGSFTNCSNADPKFVAASPSYWNSPSLFNLALQSSSPAIRTGASVGTPTFDVLGSPAANPPSLGAYEVQAAPVTPAGPCDINGDGVVNTLDVQAATNQALGVNTCGTADLLRTGQCSVVGVQRVIIAVMGGTCKVGM